MKPSLFVWLWIILFPLSALSQTEGKIIFSNQLIDPAKPEKTLQEFKAGDPIYAMAFVPKSFAAIIKNETAKKTSVEIFLYVIKPPLYSYQQPSENQLVFSTLWISGKAMQNTKLPLDIVPQASSMTAYGTSDLTYTKFGQQFDGPVKFAEALSGLERGKHTIMVKLNCNYESVAEGQFTIEGTDFSVYKNLSDKLNAAAAGIQTQSATVPKPAMTDAKLEAEMLDALKSSQTFKTRMQGAVLKLVITDPDWSIRRHEISGAILHRYIRAAVAVKEGGGTCRVWPLVTFQQDYVGNRFQKAKFDGVGDPYQIPCENVK
ncbi:MAG: hypothetical protein HY961_00270 [Ignavibacteriae bacterium]|nr:hypothetical protein [Ignavibacteriota bacterium]